jgi:outer membrane murein-binding lipoprotein Lpp
MKNLGPAYSPRRIAVSRIALFFAFVCLLFMVAGCATSAAVDAANENVDALRTDLTSFTEEIKATGALNEEQQAALDKWSAFATESLDDIQESLDPVDLESVGTSVANLTGLIGGPVGASGGLLGGILIALDQRRRRKRTVRGVVASVESGRGPDGVVDFKKVAEAQKFMGIRREIRDATMHVTGDLTHE